jgi:hypothetical protein
MKVVRNVETVNFAFGHIFIRGRLLPQKRPARYSQKSCRDGNLAGECLPGWKPCRDRNLAGEILPGWKPCRGVKACRDGKLAGMKLAGVLAGKSLPG